MRLLTNAQRDRSVRNEMEAIERHTEFYLLSRSSLSTDIIVFFLWHFRNHPSRSSLTKRNHMAFKCIGMCDAMASISYTFLLLLFFRFKSIEFEMLENALLCLAVSCVLLTFYLSIRLYLLYGFTSVDLLFFLLSSFSIGVSWCCHTQAQHK